MTIGLVYRQIDQLNILIDNSIDTTVIERFKQHKARLLENLSLILEQEQETE